MQYNVYLTTMVPLSREVRGEITVQEIKSYPFTDGQSHALPPNPPFRDFLA